MPHRVLALFDLGRACWLRRLVYVREHPGGVHVQGRRGDQSVEVFDPADDLYCVFRLANAPPDTRVAGRLIAVDTDAGKDIEVASNEMSQSSGNHHFVFTLPRPWPEGRYRVDLLIEDEVEESVEFRIEAESAALLFPEPSTM